MARGSYRLVDPAEIRTLHDLDYVVVFLTKHLAIDFAANGIRFYGHIIEQFTALERYFMLCLCWGLLKRPHRWVSIKTLVDTLYPLPEDDNAFFITKPEHCLHTLAYQLRRKLREDHRKPAILCCGRKKGYMLCAESGFGYAFVRVYQSPEFPEFS